MEKLTITQDMIEAGMSKNGALSFKQINLLGVGRYSGWRNRAIGKEIRTEKYTEFLALKDVHLKNKKKHKNSVLLKQALDFIYEHFSNEDGFNCPFKENCDYENGCDECKIKLEYDILMQD
ncbi:unnamed protein product [marine sediment metagenome]|uniref:Uncharacterized protein n=1 Tax=marine sediment metagenome TaxID=412755 RepID=X1CFP1_9ZZZZ